MRETVIALTCATAKANGEAGIDSSAPDEVIWVSMAREARGCWLAPTADEAFVAWAAALMGLWPEKKDVIQAELKAIGDRSKIMNALMNDVPVDFARIDVADYPEGSLGLLRLWEESYAEE